MAKVPSYRLHKPTGKAVVTINYRDYYLGKHGTRESKREYDRLIQLIWDRGQDHNCGHGGR